MEIYENRESGKRRGLRIEHEGTVKNVAENLDRKHIQEAIMYTTPRKRGMV